MVGRQTPFLALVVPLILVGMVDGMRGIRQAGRPRWSAASRSRSGSSRARTTSRSSSPTSSPSLLSVGAIVAFLRVWQPTEPLRGGAALRPRPAIAGAAAADAALETEVSRREGGDEGTRLARATSSPPTRRT